MFICMIYRCWVIVRSSWAQRVNCKCTLNQDFRRRDLMNRAVQYNGREALFSTSKAVMLIR